MDIVSTIKRYKYLPFNEGSLQVILTGTIKFTKPSEFNDPFDSNPSHKSYNIEKFIDNRPDLVEKVSRYLNLNQEQVLQEKPLFIDRLKEAINKGHYDQEMSDNVGICSLSRDPLNLLMWAHYSKSHTGFVVEFDIPITSYDLPKNEVSFLELLIPQEVKYCKEKPIISFDDSTDDQLDKRFLVKGIDWAYEQEERIIDYIRKDGIHKYDQENVLCSVIAGLKMEELEFTSLKKSVQLVNNTKNMNISLHKVEIVKDRFELVVKDRPDLKSIKNIK